MSSIAVAHSLPQTSPTDLQPDRRSKGSRNGRHIRAPYALLPWVDVPVNAPVHFQSNRKKLPGTAWLLIAVALIFHATIIWYATHHISQSVKPTPRELALEFVAPPKPPEPKIEPPKPQPPKPQVIKQAQVLQQIQQATPEPSDTPSVSSEPPVAVAPVSDVPPPALEPVTAAIGRAGYLNNPPPNYPPMAARQGWQGTVVLRVHVLSNGKPDVVEVQKSSGKKVLDDEAVRTVQSSWTYTPAKRGVTPIDGWTTTPIEFRLDG